MRIACRRQDWHAPVGSLTENQAHGLEEDGVAMTMNISELIARRGVVAYAVLTIKAVFIKQSQPVLNALGSTLRRTLIMALLARIGFAGSIVPAQQKSNIAGDYAGTLGPLHLKLHLAVSPEGALSGTLDSPDQGAVGLPCADFHLDGTTLSFSVPSVHGPWKGSVGSDSPSLSGTWDQGSPLPLNFVRETFALAAQPSPVDGIWLGTLEAGPAPRKERHGWPGVLHPRQPGSTRNRSGVRPGGRDRKRFLV